MVHKKSEYQLNYRWNPSNLYEAAWTSGHSYRVQRRLHDYSHLPLPWEVYGCECDDEEAEEGETQLPVPKTRLKHNVLKEVWERSKREVDTKEPVNVAPSLNQPTEDWYRRWEEKEHKKPSPIHYLDQSSPDRRPLTTERRQCPQRIEQVSQRRESIDRMVKRNGVKDEEKRIIQEEINKASALIDGRKSISPSRFTRGTQTHPGGLHTSKSPAIQRRDLQATQPASKQSCAPKFLPYGWASCRDVADKKTFNVFAPTRHLNQFYSSALRAWKRRECDIVDSIREEMRPRSQTPVRSASNVFANPSSIWMTEYQKEFSGSRKHSQPPRPMTAPPGQLRQLGNNYHKWCV